MNISKDETIQSIDIFPWDDNFNIGLKKVDEQHRKLVEILNRLATHIAYGSKEEDLSKIFDELASYTVYHFQTEEAIGHEYFPEDVLSLEHKKIHQKFVETVQSFKDEESSKPFAKLADEVIVFLAKWLASHILDSDRHLGYIVFAMQKGLTLEKAKIQAKEEMSNSSILLTEIVISIYHSLSTTSINLMRELKRHTVFEKNMSYQEEYRQILLEMSTSFINISLDKIDWAINNSLESMAKFTGADRAYIFDYNINAQTSSNTYEWCADKISPEIENLQNLPIEVLADWLEIHSKGDFVLIQDVYGLPQGDLRETLVPQKIQSLVTIPLMEDKICKGFVGFDSVKTKHHFSDDEIELLTLFSHLLASVNKRKKIELDLFHEKSFLKTLIHTIPDLVWLKDTKGIYMACNTRFEEFFGEEESLIVGKSDYDFVEKELADFFRMHDKKVMYSVTPSVNEEELIFADGHKELILATKVPMYDGDNKLIGVLGVGRDITERQQQQEHLEYIAHYDSLTGLPNRVLLSERIHQAFAHTKRNNLSFAVVYLDLDGFKDINDKHGHDYGDKLLEALSEHMKNSIRKSDTISRLGGDEFVAVFLDLKTHKDCIPMLKRLLQACLYKVVVDNIEMQVSASLGVTFFDKGDDIDADQLLRQADQAMYHAKLSGKNRYYLFDAQKDEKIRIHHESLEEIENALVNDEFILYYQPKVNMKTAQVIGAEALIRWNHPKRGIVAPGNFLPIIQGHTLSVRLGNWVLNRAMEQITEFKSKGINIPISINVDAMQLQQHDFVEQLKKLLIKYPAVEAKDFSLEVLETSALEDIVHVSQIMQSCMKIGISFSLDDFGTGYSSLTYLKRLPVKELKIDQSFVRDMLEDPEDLAILDGILGLASAFHREVIAEGVETVEHGEMLLKLGCEKAQGYVIAKPMPAKNILTWIAEYKPNEKWQNTKTISRNDLPLLYAIVEHKAWLSSILSYLQNIRHSPPILNDKECHFSKWINDSAMEIYSHNKEFKEIQFIHHKIHDISTQLIKEFENNTLENLEISIDKIKKLSIELVNLFKDFENTK